MHRRKFLAGSATVALSSLTLLSGCERRSAPKTGSRKITVAQWGQERYLIYLPFYIAQEAGLFQKRDLEVNLNFSGNDDQVFAAVARGDAQFGIGDPIFAAISRDRGADGVVLGQLVGRVALWGVSKTAQRQLRVPNDFSGLTVGTFPRPSTTYTLLRNMIDQNKVPGARIAEVPIGSELALLESGGADVVMMLEPAASIAESKGYRVVTSFPELWGPFAFTGVTSTEAYVTRAPEVTAALRQCLQDALDLAHQAPNRAKAIACTLFSNIDQSVVGAAVDRMIQTQTLPLKFGLPSEAWSAAINVRKQIGELKNNKSYDDVVIN